MRLYLIGVNHYDPFHRGLLLDWLSELRNANGANPAFIANELTDEAIAAILPQRTELVRDAQRDWAMLDKSSLRSLGLSLGYDADTHWTVFGRDRSLWLGYETDVTRFAINRLACCHQFVDPLGAPTDGPDFLQKLSVGANENAQKAGRGDQRDLDLAGQILNRIASHGGDWGICILGDNHTRSFDDTTASLLRAERSYCKVSGVRHLLRTSTYEDE